MASTIPAAPAAVAFDAPLHPGVIANSVAIADKYRVEADAAAAAEYSRSCHSRLREQPNLALFDACSAFDEVTLLLNLDDPLADSGPFNGSAVVSREVAAARALSKDFFDADSRLRQIRTAVELELVPNGDWSGGEPAASR